MRQSAENAVAAVKKSLEGTGVSVVGSEIHEDIPGEFSIRITLKGEGSDARAKEVFGLLASGFGLEPGDWGKTLVVRGTAYRIIALEPSEPDHAVIVEAGDGDRRRCAPSVVEKAKALGQLK